MRRLFRRWSSLLLPFCFVAAGGAQADFDAAGVYAMRCASCHGEAGEGTRAQIPPLGPALRGNPLVINAPEPILIQIIRKGRQGAQRVYDDTYPNMPAFSPLHVEDAQALVAYLKTDLQE